MKMIWTLLRKNISIAQLAGFMLANIVGLTIIIVGVQIYTDVEPIIGDEDSFIKKDYIVINKKVSGSDLITGEKKVFSESEIAEIESQDWVRKVGRFQSANYQLYASVSGSGRSMSTFMFFESLPRDFIDVAEEEWDYQPGNMFVPIIISKDYLNLYNFGFASSVGLPQMSENMLGSIPLNLQISGNGLSTTLQGRVVGFSNRLNTILVPEEFMSWSNNKYGNIDKSQSPSRLIIDVNSPGDVRIAEYMSANNYEISGEQDTAEAAYFLRIITGSIVIIGSVILLLSFAILLLSISLLMQKNKDKIHSLLMLGYNTATVSRPYIQIVVIVNVIAFIVSAISMIVFRIIYYAEIQAMVQDNSSVWLSVFVGMMLAAAISIFNIISICRKVKKAFWI